MINSIQQAWNLQDRKSKEHAYITTNVSPNTITAKFSYVCCFLEIIRAIEKDNNKETRKFLMYNVKYLPNCIFTYLGFRLTCSETLFLIELGRYKRLYLCLPSPAFDNMGDDTG